MIGQAEEGRGNRIFAEHAYLALQLMGAGATRKDTGGDRHE